MVKARIARNSIHKIQLADGSFSSDSQVVKDHAVSHFKHLLNRQPQLPCPTLVHSVVLSEKERSSLCDPISKGEIKSALFAQKPLSCPGPDGFSAYFFQLFWPTIKEEFVDALLKAINHTFISLIPKTKLAESFNDFQPISLCNVTFKTITKVMATHLQKGLSRILDDVLDQVRVDKFIHSPLNISHLFFADDLIIFSDASPNTAKMIKDTNIETMQTIFPKEKEFLTIMNPSPTIRASKSLPKLFGVDLSKPPMKRKSKSMIDLNKVPKKRSASVHWTEDEHGRFLEGLQALGRGKWAGIARDYVITRNATQMFISHSLTIIITFHLDQAVCSVTRYPLMETIVVDDDGRV
ncbi:hypothetical protein QJS10_CPB21g01207 [Acorus calamus]|uniref:MYB transcription factor n=1 Tax=Acorus calamus TaxID=4465 RepID=A0AAV9C4H1_ACOCL|nr:hypothetical protein QJS10_CPB21g01207 [Acorus calamus]